MPGGPPGARGGAPTRGRPPQRRARRRRRNLEELEPTQLTTYTPSTAPVPEGEVIVERGSTARDLGPKLNRSAGDVIRFLLLQGEMVTATQSLTDDMIELFAAELGADVRLVDPGEEKEAELLAKFFEDEEVEETDEEDLRPRPPVVTVMGHVDHGKTLLLDRIRSTDVVAGEAGGITQHIGAYQVSWADRLITFIDTPGHEAFTAMRARGAEVTDIVVLVVAADDGVMPQTVEAIDHARAADVPIVVAINKMDRPDANPDRVLQQLSERGLVPEAWGGDTIVVQVSALQSEGIEELLEQLLLVADVEELRASPEGRARGTVLEANLEAGRGPVATVIVQHGTLRVGDPLVAGAAWGKAKALVNDHGDHVKEALPSTPVQVLGFSEPPQAGDEVRAAQDLGTARTLGEARAQRFRLSGHLPLASAATGAKLEDLFEQIQRGETATLNLILKADVQGSLEAVTESLRKLERDDVRLSFVRRGVGGITENDVDLAKASNATIIGFNVRPDRRAREMAESSDVEIRTYEIIYKLIEDIQAAMLGLLAPEFEEVVTGEAEVRQVFRIPRVGAIAGCYVREGVITRGSKVRFLREGVIIWKGSISSLRRFKEDVREVASGFECGIGLSDYQDLKEGDVIETFEEREIPRT
jgi:translation initiation factor IF-2